MIKAFEEGETYRNSDFEQDIFVLYAEKVKNKTNMAILWVDRETTETTDGAELVVADKDLAKWQVINY